MRSELGAAEQCERRLEREFGVRVLLAEPLDGRLGCRTTRALVSLGCHQLPVGSCWWWRFLEGDIRSCRRPGPLARRTTASNSRSNSLVSWASVVVRNDDFRSARAAHTSRVFMVRSGLGSGLVGFWSWRVCLGRSQLGGGYQGSRVKCFAPPQSWKAGSGQVAKHKSQPTCQIACNWSWVGGVDCEERRR